MWIGPDGSSHKFFNMLHTDDEGTAGNQRFTRDGSYLRLTTSGPNTPRLEFPDGTYHVFGPDGWPTWMYDRFLNWVKLTYPPNNTTWKIEDSEGRLHHVYFESNWRNGGKVDAVEVQAYGSTPGNRLTATYDLEYQNRSIRRTCQDTWWANNETPGDPNAQEAFLTLPMLKKVTGPIEESDPNKRVQWLVTDGQQNAAYHLGAVRSNNQCHFAGVIEQLELPTHGKTTWDWKLWDFPATGKAYVDSSPGVWHRTIVNDQSMDWDDATWLYTQTLVSYGVRTDVRDPENNVTKYWFYAPANATLPWDYSLPIYKGDPPDGEGRYLSQQRVSPGGVVREIWLKFVSDNLSGIGNNDQILSNRRVVSSKVVYVDDGGPAAPRVAETEFRDFDGLGHYREAEMTGNFDLGSNSRTERTQWNDSRGCYSQCTGAPNHTIVPSLSPWVLGTFAYTRQSEAGDIATQEFAFNTSTGFLNQRRVLIAQMTQSNNDVLVQHCPDGFGRMISERYYGGDTNTLAGKVIGCGPSSDSTYRLDYEYLNGVVSRSTYKTPAGASVGFDNFTIPAGGVDLTTGLVEVSCDSAGYCTEFDYDKLGRLTQQRGAASAGNARAATVNYNYGYIAGPWQGWQVATTLACPAGLTCSPEELAGFPETTVHYDGFGKPFKNDRRNADGSWSKQYTKFGELGLPIFVSEWTAGVIGTGTEPGTEFRDFDALGRAHTIEAPDGHLTTLTFTGDRVATSTMQVASGAFPPTGPAPEAPSAREMHRDRFGRLVRVSEPSGAGGALVHTNLSYDIGGHTSQIVQGSQVRSYAYDRRGFLKSETIPEYGASGNGTRYGCSFDALGNAWKSREVPCGQVATLGVALTFDYAVRVTSVSEEASRLLKEFLYESATGRLATAKSYNYLPEVGFSTFQVNETYAYGGIAGAASSRTTQFLVNSVPEEQFTTTIALDRAGQLQSLGYPTCTGGACGVSGSAGRTVSFAHSKGYLSKIPGFVDTPISYHANGMVSQVMHSNGMRFDLVIDSATMVQRPKQINVFNSGGLGISFSGDYAYDGAGNIKAMTPAMRYRYDSVSRLVESQETWGSTTYLQKPVCDAYGNIQSLETGPAGSTQTLSTPTSAATNRLTTAATTYDVSGNLTLWANGPSYDYDRLNRMRRFRGSTSPGAEEWVFGYTADDERVLSMRVGGDGEIWSLRGADGQILREIRADESIHSLRDYVWTGRNLLAKLERSPAEGEGPNPWTEEKIHVATDHLGTPRIFTDPDGFKIEPGHIYYPFGQELTGSSDTERMKYTGHERDLWNTTSTADDLDYMHARHYNPQLGRFLQIDPLRGKAHQPQSMNRYAYVSGSPLSRIDPRGLHEEAPPQCNTTDCITVTGPAIPGLFLINIINWWYGSPPASPPSGEPWVGTGGPPTAGPLPVPPSDDDDGGDDDEGDKKTRSASQCVRDCTNHGLGQALTAAIGIGSDAADYALALTGVGLMAATLGREFVPDPVGFPGQTATVLEYIGGYLGAYYGAKIAYIGNAVKVTRAFEVGATIGRGGSYAIVGVAGLGSGFALGTVGHCTLECNQNPDYTYPEY